MDYVINPWMAGNLHQPSRDTAFMQWKGLYQELQRIADVRLLHAREGSPDMVFVAHAALVQHGVAAVSSFTHPQRQTERAACAAVAGGDGFSALGDAAGDLF